MTSGYYRFPTINQDTIVFVSEDDLWTVASTGGIARRLTSNLGEVTSPLLSSNGESLAFVGREEGGPEVYVMPAEGGSAERLTFVGSNCRVVGWTADSAEIAFTSNYGQVVAREMALFRVGIEPGRRQIEPYSYGPARSVAFGHNGEVVIGRNTGDPATWKRYRGGTAGHLWIDSNGDGDFVRLLPDVAGNIASPIWIEDEAGARVYFVSDHEGIGNLYSCLPDGTDLQRQSDHEDYYARNPSSDGRRIVYHAGADLYVFDPAAGESARVDVQYRSPRVQRNRKFVSAGRYLDAYDPHPSGQAVAVSTRGKAYSFSNHDGPVLQQGKRDGVRYRLPTWLEDGKRLVLVTDEPGEETLEIHSTNPDGEVKRLDDLDLGRVVTFKTSPVEKKVAISNHRHELLLVDLETEELTVVDRGAFRRIDGFDWSPDGRWLAYSFAATMSTTEIRLYQLPAVADENDASEPDTPDGDKAVDGSEGSDAPGSEGMSEGDTSADNGGKIYTITHPVLHDMYPAFDPDGKYLYFISYREFNPVYDALHFDLGFPWGMRPYLITLRADLPNPFLPMPNLADGVEADEEDEDEEDEDEDSGEDDNGDSDDDGAYDDEESDDDDEWDEEEDDGEHDDAVRRGRREPRWNPGWRILASGEGETTGRAVNRSSEGQPDSEANGPGKGKGKKNGKKKGKPVQIDLDGIERRVVAFPVPDGRYGQIAGIPGKALFTVFPVHGQLDGDHDWDDEDGQDSGTLRSYDFKEYKSEALAENVSSFKLSANRKKLFYSSSGRLRVIAAGEKAPSSSGNARKTGWIGLQRVKVSVDPQSEWEQMFREAWRLQRDQFWTEDMGQVDWQIIYSRYFQLIPRVSTRSEFSDLMWEMQGELGTSHAYEFGGDYRARPYYGQGFLGTSLRWDGEAGGYRVGELILGDAWDEKSTSPLAAPGVDVQPGDLLVALNGQSVDGDVSPEQLLVNQAGNEVLLTLAPRQNGTRENGESADSGPEDRAGERDSAVDTGKNGRLRTVVVRAIASEVPARYRQWVEGNRQRVHEATDGRVGYVHIPDMGARGYAEFHRGYLAEVDRDALIVDVRYNGGGHVSQLILEKLARRRIGYDLSRWSGLIPYPVESVAGPIVALTNEHAGSDGDIFCHSFKLMKLGPLIGKRTWGGVIGIFPRHALVDGTITTQPEYSFWFEDVGWNVENYGTDPDIVVEMTPQDYAAKRDPQLATAIDEATRLLTESPVQRPQLEPRPVLALPKLPPRS